MKQKLYTLLLIAAALLAVCFVLTLIWSFLILAVIALIIVIHGKAAVPETGAENDSAQPVSPRKRKSGSSGCLTALAAGAVIFMILTPPYTVSSSFLWQYPFQNAVLSLYRYGEPEWFPDFRKDVRSDYHFEYLPSMMQGTGFFTVHFVTTPERAAEYAKQYAEAGAEAVSLRECVADFDSAVRVNESFFPDPNAATVYVIKSNRNWNHPHSKSVTVDPASGRVEITQYG